MWLVIFIDVAFLRLVVSLVVLDLPADRFNRNLSIIFGWLVTNAKQ